MELFKDFRLAGLMANISKISRYVSFWTGIMTFVFVLSAVVSRLKSAI